MPLHNVAEIIPHLIAELTEPARVALVQLPDSNLVLTRSIEGACEAWSSTWDPSELDAQKLPIGLLSYWASHFPTPEQMQTALAHWNPTDLALCFGCLQKKTWATRTMQQKYTPLVRGIFAKHRLSQHFSEEIEQQVWVELLVGPEGKRPLIESYRGIGQFLGWLRVVVVRKVQSLLGKEKKQGLVAEEALFERLMASAPASEMSGLKSELRTKLPLAMKASLRSLDVRARNFLRHRFIDGLTLQQIGKVYGVHHTTVGRQIDRARNQLLEETKRRLVVGMALQTRECESMLKLVNSQLGMTLTSFMAEFDGDDSATVQALLEKLQE